ncbi:hypothetical protein HGRIS_002096 [Hohenbuehelia grisea]|uniref:CBM1 domain-containing protein n=1 Tax=Hohenbuehelia grisea TaxID=104357 RepID=A0ABR3JLA1_9AGAR
MTLAAAAFVLSLFVGGTLAQSPAWGQCGGTGWSGSTTCVSGYVCTVSNQWYSQCIPGSAAPSSSSVPVPTITPTPTQPGTTPSNTPTTTSSGSKPTGSQIRTVQAPVFHFYLQNSNGAPVLGPESSSGYFTLGKTISLNNADGSKLYLNVDESATTSYKALTLGTTATTTDWGLEGDTIITTAPRQLNFLACSTSNSALYKVYLQEGNDSPAGQSCTMVTMHLPCLC